MADEKLVVSEEQLGAITAKVFDKIGEVDQTTKREFDDDKLQDKYDKTNSIWMNNGYENPADQFDSTKKDQKIGYRDMVDALSTPDASILIGRVVSNVVKEAIEPLLVGSSLLHTIRFSAGQQITFPAAGAFTAEDIPEGGEINYLDSSPRMVTFYNKNSSELR